MTNFKIAFFAVFFIFCFGFPIFSECTGIVFSGGGGKGAYEIGVWKAFEERGIAQKAVALSGSSVGALNAALLVCEGYQKSEEIWTNLVPEHLTRDEDRISQKGLGELISKVNISFLKTADSPAVFASAVRARFPILKFISANLFGSSYVYYFPLNKISSKKEIRRTLLASSAFPLMMEPVKLADGHRYIDGGAEIFGGDNVPISPILENYPAISKIAVVYLEQNPQKRIRAIDHDKIELLEIIPSIDLGNLEEGTTNFSKDYITLLIRQGYEDASAILERKGIKKLAPFWFEDEPSKTE